MAGTTRVSDTVRLRGYTDLLKACDLAPKETKREVRAVFRKVGDDVKGDWSAQLATKPHSTAGREPGYGKKTATGIRTIVRRRGISVEQTRRRSSVPNLRRPNLIGLQQGIGDKVLDDHAPGLVRGMEHAIDTVADNFEKKGSTA